MVKKTRYVKCNLCNSKEYCRIFKVGSSFLVKCRKCNFIYLNPIPTDRELRKYYARLSTVSIEPIDKSPIEYDRSVERLQLIEKNIKKGKILDVGSGGSNFLFIAKSKGWETFSIEIRKEAKKLLKMHSIKILYERKIPNGFFNAITLSQVLEHLSDPSKKLKFYYNNLASGGIIVIEVPNIESLGARLMKDKWYFIKNPEHLSYFSKSTLTKILKKFGFEIIRAEYLGGTLVTDFSAGNNLKKQVIFNFYRLFKLPINLLIRICFRKMGLTDTLRVVARKI